MEIIFFMHNYWYHSPVRFYRSLEELEDITNPQNTQFFGEHKPYPLEVREFHRFLIPNYNNEVIDDELFVYLVRENYVRKLVSFCKIVDGKLKYVTFKSRTSDSGVLQIRNKQGHILFYSNCVSFNDSTDSQGRKHIRIATKHLYNKNLFNFEGDNDWIITSIPAYCLGMTSIETEISTARIGGNSTLKIKDAHVDEVVEYEVIANGDANILNFLQVHATNDSFYVDGTKRTCLEKMDRDEQSIFGKIKFTNIKDKNTGLNITLDYSELMQDIF